MVIFKKIFCLFKLNFSISSFPLHRELSNEGSEFCPSCEFVLNFIPPVELYNKKATKDPISRNWLKEMPAAKGDHGFVDKKILLSL